MDTSYPRSSERAFLSGFRAPAAGALFLKPENIVAPDRLYTDIETYSPIDLPKTGVYRYVEHPDFAILMAGWANRTAPVKMFVDRDEINDRITTALRSGKQIVAHNAAFERVCYSRSLGMKTGKYLDPEQFHDTQAVGQEHGYPKSLERMAKALGVSEKDTAGTRLINLFSKPNRQGRRNLPEDYPEQWQEFLDYCAQDVIVCRDLDVVLEELGGWPTEAEYRTFLTDQHINDRGIRINVDLAKKAVVASDENSMVAELRVMHLTGMANPNSVPQFLTWCKEDISRRIPNVRKETVQRLLNSGRLTPVQQEVLELRQGLALAAPKKYVSAINSVCADGRLRGTLSFFGAHTGRWSGKGTQVQNLPSESFTMEDPDTGKSIWDEGAEMAAIFDLLNDFGADPTELKKLVRAMFMVDGCVVDYASIEARFIAWLAGEQWALQAFRAGRDIYVETANMMSNTTRTYGRKEGKVAVLALGYQGAINSLRNMGAEGSDEELLVLVRQWRAANPAIVRLWGDLQDSLADGGDVGKYLHMEVDGETRRLWLPSGRAISYHGMRWERFRVQDPKNGKWKVKHGWRYDDPKKPGMRIQTYGGRLAENATQAGSRDLLAHGLVNLHDAGEQVVAHVHDEAVVANTRNVKKIIRLMCDTPEWAAGLPVAAEGFYTERYRKG